MKPTLLGVLVGVLLASAVLSSRQARTHITTGGTLPANCTVGDVWIKTGASAGPYWCSAVDTWTASGTGNGSVTSVAATVPSLLSIAGSPITTTGTLAFTYSGTALPFLNGGTGLTAAGDDTTLVSSGSAWVAASLPDCTDTGGNHLNYTAASNAFSCGTSGGGGSGALSGITAATGANTIASGNNSGQIWNWALTTDAAAFTLGETTAATNGTTAAQSLLTLSTLATSTATGLQINNFGASPSVLIRDVSGDSSMFWIDQDGELCIMCAAAPTQAFVITSTSDFYIDSNGTVISGDRLRLIKNGADFEIGTQSTADLQFATDTGTTRGLFLHADGRFVLKGNESATTLGVTMLGLGSAAASAANHYWMIGFGYQANGVEPPAMFGYQETLDSGNTKGDLVGYTRTTTSGVATERLRILSDGTVNITNLTTTGAATGKKIVCVDTSTGRLYASSSDVQCLN